MKHLPDFELTHRSFSQRIGRPTEFDAAIGRIVLAFSELENRVRNVIFLLLSGTDQKAAHVVTAQLSFRQKIDVLGSLLRLRLKQSPQPEMEEERLAEIIIMCQKAEELRNTYIHSTYSYRRGRERVFRAKLSARARDGLKVKLERVDSSLLLDVYDYTLCAAEEVEGIPMILGIADSVSYVGGPHRVRYSKDGLVVAEFRFGQVE